MHVLNSRGEILMPVSTKSRLAFLFVDKGIRI